MFVSSVMDRISSMQQLAMAALLMMFGSMALANTDDEAITWLEGMAEAAHQLSYIGTFVYQQGDNLQTMRIIRSVTDEGEYERLVSMSGQNREVIRAQDKVTCILPEDSSIVIEQAGSPRPFTAIPIEHLALLGEFYAIQMGGRARIADLNTRQIDIIPRDQYRFGQRLWLEENSRLLLRSEVFNERGEVIEKLLFTSLELHDHIPAEMLQPNIAAGDQILELDSGLMHRRGSSHAQASWQTSSLPPGFQQKVLRRHYLPNKFSPVEHHVYGDGLASVSVFIEERDDEDEVLIGPSRMGGINVYGQFSHGHLITVLGEVPMVTVQFIAEAMQPIVRP